MGGGAHSSQAFQLLPSNVHCARRHVKLVFPFPITHISLSSCPPGKMASRKEGTGSGTTSSSSNTGAAGKGKGKGGSGDSAVKQVQIDGLVSAVPSPGVHVGSVAPGPCLAEALLSSLSSGLGGAVPKFCPKILLFHLHFFLGRRNNLPFPLTGELRAEKGDRS